jgi:glutathionyl-hydroquinone reductase
MGMYSQTKTGCFYIEHGAVDENSIVEHTVTVADLVNLYFHKKLALGLLLFFPVTLLSKGSNVLLNKFSKTNEDIYYPFRRYLKANITNEIYTHAGTKVDLQNYNLNDHFNLVRATVAENSDIYNNELKEIFDFFTLDKAINDFLSSFNH